MQHEQITPQLWMLLSRETRDHLIKEFKVPKSGMTEIRNEELLSDGRTLEDLKVINSESMANYVGSDESFGRLFELTLAKSHAELHPPVGTISRPQDEEPVVPPKVENALIQEERVADVKVDLPIKPVVVIEEHEAWPIVDKEVVAATPKKKSYYVPVAERKAKANK